MKKPTESLISIFGLIIVLVPLCVICLPLLVGITLKLTNDLFRPEPQVASVLIFVLPIAALLTLGMWIKKIRKKS